jgi:hypothetical protein
MYRYLLPTGAAFLLGALTLSAQDREKPATPDLPRPAAASPKKGVTPDRDIPADKAPRRRAHSRVYLGVYTIPVEDMSRRVKKRLNIKEEDGVVVVEVMPDSPADEAGLRHGDVITHVNGKLIEDEDELCEDLNEMGPGKKVTLTVFREGKKKEVTAELEEGAGESPQGPFAENGGPAPGGGAITTTSQERLRRIERLERKISRLEKRLEELEKTQAAKKP